MDKKRALLNRHPICKLSKVHSISRRYKLHSSSIFLKYIVLSQTSNYGKHIKISLMKKYILFLLSSLIITATVYAQKEYKAMMDNPSVNFYDVCQSAEAYFTEHGKEKGSGWKGYQRWKVANEYKYYPTGNRDNIDPYFSENAYSAFLNQAQASSFNNGWDELGPSYVDSITGQYSVGIGRVVAIYVDPTDSLKMYIGSRSGGFWRSSNGGQTWLCTTDTLIATGANTIGVSPYNSDSVLINVANARNGYSHGIYQSNDGGISWAESNFNPTTLSMGGLGSNFKIYKIAYHPRVKDLVFVGTNYGIYRSADHLQTFTRLMNTGEITDIAFHPTDDSIVYVYNSYYYSGNRDKVQISYDQGATYSATSISGNSNKKGWLSVSPNCANCLYFASENGVWKSTNNGTNFSFMSNPNENCLGFTVNDLDTSNMIYGYVDIHASTTGGQTFSKVTYWSLGNTNGAGSGHQNSFRTSTDYVHADLHPAICVNGVFYVGTDGWFCKSSDGGISWEILSQGAGIRENYKLGISQSNHFRSISGSQDNGTSIKHESTWIEFYGADGMEAIIHPLNDDYMIGSVQYGNRKRTKDGGQSHDGASPPNTSNAAWEAPIAYNPTKQMQIFDFRDSVYVSDDFGDTWTVRGKASSFSGNINQAAIAENNHQLIVISKSDKIDKSTDGGFTFSSIKNGLPTSSIEDIAFDPNDDQTMIVVYAKYQIDNQKVYITHDGGQTWTNITYNLGNMPIRSVVIDHTSASNIYLGAEIGVYTKPMNGSNWTLYNPNLPNVTIEELEINHGSNTIKVATWGRGVWEYSILGRNNYPSVLKTHITTLPTSEKPIQGIDQYITSVISYNGTLSNVFVKWAPDTLVLGNTIAMTNTVDSTWVSNSPIPTLPVNTDIYFKVYAIGSNGDTSETYRFMYTVHEFDYCNATGNNNGGNLFIDQVSIANINNTSSNDAYTYYTDSVVYMYRDSTYSIAVHSNNSWSSNDFGAWIDFNHNAEFDANESLNLVETAGNLAEAQFTIPSNAVLSDTARLRVRLSYWGDEAQPCGNALGEVEDYPVLFMVIDTIPPILDSAALVDYTEECSATPPPPTATDNIMGTIYGTANHSFPISTLGTTVVIWTFTDANGNFVQQNQNIVVTPVDTTVTKMNYTLTALANNYNYQWVDCNNGYTPISGAINQSYTATFDGDFAVIISGNACADTSFCFNITGTGIDELYNQFKLELFPNPTQGIIHIRNIQQVKLALEVSDMNGRKLISKEIVEEHTEVNLNTYSSGIYIFKFYNNQEVFYLKVIKK